MLIEAQWQRTCLWHKALTSKAGSIPVNQPMDFSKLKKATDPVFEELYENLFSGEEKAASQGAGASLTETGEPCVCLFFRKNDPKGVFGFKNGIMRVC